MDSAFILHWTNKESIWLPFKDTLHVSFKTTGIDFYHINYTKKDKNYNARIFLDTGHIEIVSSIKDEKLIIDTVTGSPMFYKTKKWDDTYNNLLSLTPF